MQRPLQIQTRVENHSSRRIAGLMVAGAINIAFVYALTSGMAMKIVKAIPQSLEVSVIATQEKPQPVIAPPKTAMVEPQTDATMAPPEIQIQSEASPVTATTTPSTPSSDSVATSRGSTHTIPPYPPEARRLGQQGTVMLRLVISPAGEVTQADVVQSSGVPLLDQTAAAWVMAHWKYKPAVQGGAAVESTTTAAVKFDLKHA